MPTRHKTGLSSEIFHFDIEYHVTSNLLPSNRVRLVVIKEPKSGFYAGLFFGDGIRPEVVAIFLVNF